MKIKIGEIEIESQRELTFTVPCNNEVEQKNTVSVEECFEYLGISEHYEKAFNSNSNGELFHLNDYFEICMTIQKNNIDVKSFTEWFNFIVSYAYENWQRPISIYQHIGKLFNDELLLHLNEREY